MIARARRYAASYGGFSPNARDVFQEGFVTQGLKLVERGPIALKLRLARRPIRVKYAPTRRAATKEN